MRIVVVLLLVLVLTACGGAGLEGENGTQGINVTSSGALAPVIAEGDSGNNLLNLTFTAESNSTIRYRTQDIDAVAKSDYLPTSGEMAVSAGQSYSIEVETYADTRIEGDEKFALILEDDVEGELSRIEITIQNDDFPVISVLPLDITEGDVGDAVVQFEISLSESTIDPFPLLFKTIDQSGIGYAEAGVDYLAKEELITFVEGELSKTVVVTTLADFNIEPDELIEVTISHFNNVYGPYAATIRSDDYPGSGAPTLLVNNGSSMNVAESSSGAVFEVDITIDEDGGFDRNLDILAYLSPLAELPAGATDDLELAELDKDFLGTAQSLTLVPGTIHYTTSFSILDDEDLERNEILELILANAEGAIFGRGRIYISDNEFPEFRVYKKYSVSGSEETSEKLTYLESSDALGGHRFFIELVSSAGYDYQFEYKLRLATVGEINRATDENDFFQSVNDGLLQRQVLTIEKGNNLPSGNEANGISFSIEDDDIVEGNESFFLELLNVNGSPIGSAYEIKILNDDLPDVQWVNSNIVSPATVALPFKTNEEDNLALELQIANDGSLGDVALETFDIVISRSVASEPVCSWRSDNNLSTAELLIAQEGEQVFSEGAASISVLLNSQDDSEIECDEVVSLNAILSSRNEGVTDTKTASEVITIVNTDVAQLDVIGFSASEAAGSAQFQVQLNAPIALSALFDIDHVTTEAGDVDFQYNSQPIVISDSSRISISFDESSNNRQQSIVATLNNDTMVELDERVQLNLDLTSLSGSVPLQIRQCTAPPASVCSSLTNNSITAVVSGEIQNDDKAIIEILAKSSETISEASLSALNLLDEAVSHPYKIVLSNDIAADVPAIQLTVSDRCILASADDCADGSDFSNGVNLIHDGVNQTNTGERNLNFVLLMNDDVVEPDELAKLSISLHNAVSTSQYVNNWSDQSLNYLIENDDFLTVDISTAAVSYDEGSTTDFSISWDKAIAENVENITIGISEVCDESANIHCTQTSDDGSHVTGDLSFSNVFVLHSNGGGTAASPLGSEAGIAVSNDNLVEQQESSELVFELNDANQINSYLTASWSTQTRSFNVNNTDKLALNFQFVNSQIVEGNGTGSVDAGLTVSWAQNIASNVTDISLNLAEVCDNFINSYCVSDVAGEDVSFDLASVTIHSQGVQTFANSGLSLGMNVIADDLVEPLEQASVEISLANALVLNELLATSWTNQARYLQVNNDDLITPVLAFSDDPDIASGLEDTDKDLSSGNTVGLVLSWGDSEIAANALDLVLEINHSCNNCGTGQDYTVADGEKVLSGLSASGQLQYAFDIVTDDLVEPNESVQFTLNKKTSTPTHYFSTDPLYSPPANFSELTYTIENDDRLLLDVVRADASSSADIAESVVTPLHYSWTGKAAENLPDIDISVAENCDNNDVDSALPKCLAVTTSLNNSPPDYSASDTRIFSSGTALDASIVAQAGAVQLSLNDDDWVEVDESLQLVFNIPASVQSYVRFDTVGSSQAAPDFQLAYNLSIQSDDVLQVAINSATTSGDVSDESAEASQSYALTFDRSVEQDVPQLAINWLEGNTPATLYASRSSNFSTQDDYRVFYGAEQSSDLVAGNEVIIKASGSSLTSASESLILRVGDDSLVEDDETVAFRLNETSDYFALYDSGVEVVQGSDTTERSFIIALEDKADLGIRFAANLTDAEINSLSEGDSLVAVNAIVTGLTSFDSNLGTLQLTSAVNCKAGQATCDATEASSSATINLDTSVISASSLISLGFSLDGDLAVEPDEVVELNIDSSAHAKFFTFNSNASREFTILNDDFLILSYTDNSSAIIEGDAGGATSYISLMIDDKGEGVELSGATSISYSISALTAVGDNAEATGSNKDYDFTGSPGSRSMDITSLLTAPYTGVQHDLVAVYADNHIEDDELLNFSLSLAIDAALISPGENTSPEFVYTIADDDYLSLYLADTALQPEDSGQYQIKICDKQGAGIEADFTINLLAGAPYLDTSLSESLQVDQLALEDTDFSLASSSINIQSSDIQNTHAEQGNDCALETLPITLSADSNLEKNEWFGLELSAASNLCASANNICAEVNLVVKNDELQNVLDTGAEQCLKADGSTEEYSGSCSQFLSQDVEVNYPVNQYTYVGTSGELLTPRLIASAIEPPSSYACIQDDRSGLLWSVADLPFDGSHSADGILWSGSILDNAATFEGLFSTGFCGFSSSGKKWQLPNVEQLMGIINYQALQVDAVFDPGVFQHNATASGIYWSKDSCAADKFWAVNVKAGTLVCLDKSDQHHIRAVYY
jgi:hypothetical protein